VVINIVDNHYGWALVLFVLAGISDALDGLLARWLEQRTVLGQFLDPIADKLLLSSMFLVLSIVHRIPWKFTVLVFSRDLSIVITSAVIFATTSFRDFRPSFFGKANTVAQVVTIFSVLLYELRRTPNVAIAKSVLLWVTLALTILSGVHYIIITGQRLRAQQTRAAGQG
jgi:cardiolipin synthase